MKKIFSILLATAAIIGVTSSCSDVPMPYDINNGVTSFGKKLPYKSASLSSFSTYDTKGLAAWSQGSSYTQATGYQTWEGSTKTNKEVESYLISPAINTTAESGKVRISFDQTIRYTDKVSNWATYHKIYISKNFNGNSKDFSEASWEELSFTPKASPYSDWTLYTSGYINVPEDYVNHDSVYIAFYFYAPESNSTTWELENFLIEEGDAGETVEQDSVTIGQSLDEALTVAEARTVIASGTGLDAKYYVKGTIHYIKEIDTSSYGNATYSISDGTDTLIVYRGYGLGKAKFTSATDIKVGDEVVVYGQLVNYSGNTPEFTQGSQIVSLNGTVKDVEAEETPVEDPNAEVKGSGTLEDPYNIAAVIAEAKKLGKGETGTTDYYFKGKVVSIKEVSASYGNATFYISDDGTTTNQFYVYRALGLGNKNVTNESFMKVGDEVVVCGKLANYNGTLETSQKNAYVYSVNGVTESEDSGEETGETGTSEGVSIDGTTVTLTNSAVTAGTEIITVNLNEQELTNATDVTSITLTDGTVISFDKGGNATNAPKFYDATKGVRVYGNNTITFTGKSAIAKIVMTCDSYNGTDYVGQTTATVSFNGNTATYTNAGTATTQLRVQTITITYAAASSSKTRR